MEDNREEQKISKFNAGVSIQIRLDKLWIDSHEHSRSGFFKKWNSDLDCIWVELAGDIKYKEKVKDKSKDEKKDSEYLTYKNDFDSLDKKLFENGDFEDGIGSGFNPITKEQIVKRANQYKILMEKSLFLKRLEKYLGKGTKWDDEDEDDF